MILSSERQLAFDFWTDCPLQSQKDELNTDVWSDDEIRLIHENIFDRNVFGPLDGRVSKMKRDRMVQWIMSTELQPFSFEFCCILKGIHANEFRIGYLAKLKKISSASH